MFFVAGIYVVIINASVGVIDVVDIAVAEHSSASCVIRAPDVLVVVVLLLLLPFLLLSMVVLVIVVISVLLFE